MNFSPIPSIRAAPAARGASHQIVRRWCLWLVCQHNHVFFSVWTTLNLSPRIDTTILCWAAALKIIKELILSPWWRTLYSGIEVADGLAGYSGSRPNYCPPSRSHAPCHMFKSFSISLIWSQTALPESGLIHGSPGLQPTGFHWRPWRESVLQWNILDSLSSLLEFQGHALLNGPLQLVMKLRVEERERGVSVQRTYSWSFEERPESAMKQEYKQAQRWVVRREKKRF